MKVKLRAVHGKFSDRNGETGVMEIAVTKRRFVIGSGGTCHMVCKSRSVSELHCELLIDEHSVEVRDLGGDFGTFVNDERISANRRLSAGDHLRVGKLEFEIVFEREVVESPLRRVQGDAVDELVTDLLVKADAIEREQRSHDPNARVFKPEPAVRPMQDEVAAEVPRKVPPPRKAPGKLPVKPNIQGKDTVDAAQKALEQLFDHGKKKTDT